MEKLKDLVHVLKNGKYYKYFCVREHARITAEILKKKGFNVEIKPVKI